MANLVWFVICLQCRERRTLTFSTWDEHVSDITIYNCSLSPAATATPIWKSKENGTWHYFSINSHLSTTGTKCLNFCVFFFCNSFMIILNFFPSSSFSLSLHTQMMSILRGFLRLVNNHYFSFTKAQHYYYYFCLKENKN